MTRRSSKPRHSVRPFAVLAVTGALLATTAGALRAEPAVTAGAGSPGLVGTWTVEVTLRDCATDAPIGSFKSLVTFHQGGTISESAASRSFAPGQRGAAHGRWARKGEAYRQRMIALIVFDTPANLPGTPGFDPTCRFPPASGRDGRP
jgi:hypothetical protein